MTITVGWKRERILVLVKAYPQPSKKYGESVCTAGITSTGEWIRLFPVEFRTLPIESTFEKWTWIEANIIKSSDPRPESHKIDHDSIISLHKVETSGQWRLRKKILLPLCISSLEELKTLHDLNKTSLGIFKPKHVEGLVIEPTSQEWNTKKQEALNRAISQPSLFDRRKVSLKPIEKVPYKFSYKFTCDNPNCKGHTLQILDWEINQSYRKWKIYYGSEEIALEMIRKKYFEEFTEKCDLYFIMGTLKSMDKFRQFSIIGLVYPPKVKYEQFSLF